MTSGEETFTDEPAGPMAESVHRLDVAGPPLDSAAWVTALSLDDFIAQATVHQNLWQTTRRVAHIDDILISSARALRGPLRALVLLEDWCGDAIHTVPVVQRLIEANSALVMRILRRDEQDALMAAHLTGAARAIPVVIVYDADGRERGWWGPRPSALQSWVQREGRAMETTERYRAIRTWYARDRGATTAAEVLALLQHADRAHTDRTHVGRSEPRTR